jgi:hypothetical protein
MADPTSSPLSTSQPEKTMDDKLADPRRVGRDPNIEARERIMAELDERIIADRAADDQRFFASADVDARAAALAAEMAKEARGAPLDVDRGHRDLAEQGGEAEPANLEDGAADVEAMNPPPAATKPAVREAQRISHKGEDPLGEYVVRVEGKPKFRTVVDGKERLIDLDDARRELQYGLAAKIRFDQANELKRQLEAKLRAPAPTPVPAKPAAPAIDDLALAQGLVRSLVSEPEDKAAAKMAETFRTIRQAAAPAVDVNAVETRAAERALRTIAERENQRALQSGLGRFKQDYPDIASDPDLFTLADKRTNDIAAANPTWAPEQVMLEAGKQTREWMAKLGVKPSNAAVQQASNRQQRKETLVPMPQTRTTRPVAAKAEETDNSPQGIMAELRKSRGQPY